MTRLRGQSNYKEVSCLHLLIVSVIQNGIEIYVCTYSTRRGVKLED